MLDTPFGRDMLILGIAVTFGLCAGALTTRDAQPESPVWPIRIWLLLFCNHPISWLKRYPSRRDSFSRREQFLAAFFAWFFIAFVIGAIALGCSYRTGCQ